jgi:tRNA(Ile)-lysidine synthase
MQLDQNWVMQQGADAMLLHSIDGAFGDNVPDRIGIAVSGGGDSVALLHLFARWSAQTGHPISAVTVDHSLRAESRAEAEGVGALCGALDIPHDILTWSRPEGAGNLAALARDGRYALMAQWARTNGIDGIALGHTIDDNAENFLMRLGRSAGVDGLAEMKTRFKRDGIVWARPIWQQQRAELRCYLERHNVTWVDDPSNDDPRYSRTLVRRALPAFEEIGITPETLHHSAFALRQARDALAFYTHQEAQTHIIQEGGDLLIPERIRPPIPVDIERRLTVAALQWVGSSLYPPRKMPVAGLAVELQQQQRMTLSGCLIMRRKGQLRITREYNAVKDMRGPTNAVWDSRWHLDGPHADDLEVRALGEGVSELPDWRATGIPRPSLMASPSVWRGDTLLAVPLAQYNPDWTAQIVADFTSFLLSH